MVLLVNRAGKKTSYFIMTLTNIGNYFSVILLCVLFAVHLTMQGWLSLAGPDPFFLTRAEGALKMGLEN